MSALLFMFRRPYSVVRGRIFHPMGLLVLGFLAGSPVCAIAESPAGAKPKAGEFFRLETDAGGKEGKSEPAAQPIPERPAARVFDDARIFSPEERKALESLLAAAAKDDHLDIYVAASTFVIGESLEERAQRMCDAWTTEKRGLLFLYLRGEQQMTMCAPQGDEPFLPKAVLFRHYEEAVGAGMAFERPAERIQTTVSTIIVSLRKSTARQEEMAKVFDPDVLRVLAFFISALVILAGGGLFLARFLSRMEQAQDARIQFPTSPVPPRFGAPFGGGVCAEITFARRE